MWSINWNPREGREKMINLFGVTFAYLLSCLAVLLAVEYKRKKEEKERICMQWKCENINAASLSLACAHTHRQTETHSVCQRLNGTFSTITERSENISMQTATLLSCIYIFMETHDAYVSFFLSFSLESSRVNAGRVAVVTMLHRERRTPTHTQFTQIVFAFRRT